MSKVHEILGHSLHPTVSELVFGLELEMEYVADFNCESIPSIARIEKDNSLRNNGQEFISEPCSLEDALAFFKAVMHDTKCVKYSNYALRCSERGSIHVHANVLNLEQEDVVNILRLYAMLEPAFFNFVAPHRRNNIYCVPVYSTQLVSYLHKNDLFSVSGAWHKYTALNAKPITGQGTIEFRHLQATDDEQTLSNWLNIIKRLFAYATSNGADFSFARLLEAHSYVFQQSPSDEVRDIMMLCHQEDVICRTAISVTTLIERIKQLKKAAV